MENVKLHDVEENDDREQGDERDEEVGKLLVIGNADVFWAVCELESLGNVFFDHQRQDESAEYDLDDNADQTADETGSRAFTDDLHGQHVYELRCSGAGQCKGINTEGEQAHDIALRDASALHEAKCDGIECDQRDQTVHAAVGEQASGDDNRENAGDIGACLGAPFFEQCIGHRIADRAHGAGPVIDLCNQVAGKDRREQ